MLTEFIIFISKKLFFFWIVITNFLFSSTADELELRDRVTPEEMEMPAHQIVIVTSVSLFLPALLTLCRYGCYIRKRRKKSDKDQEKENKESQLWSEAVGKKLMNSVTCIISYLVRYISASKRDTKMNNFLKTSAGWDQHLSHLNEESML